jgi:hypothetical protein
MADFRASASDHSSRYRTKYRIGEFVLRRSSSAQLAARRGWWHSPTMIQPHIEPEHLRELSDAELQARYQRTSGEVGDAEADALCAEIARRELDL